MFQSTIGKISYGQMKPKLRLEGTHNILCGGKKKTAQHINIKTLSLL